MKGVLPEMKLCNPAYFYLVISVISLVIMTMQNVNSSSMYCVGEYSCPVPNKAIVFIIKVLYIVFWTWLLNLICKSGAPIVSWILVLLPFVLMFFLIATFILYNGRSPSFLY